MSINDVAQPNDDNTVISDEYLKLTDKNLELASQLSEYKQRYEALMKSKEDQHYHGDTQPIKLMESQMTPEEFMGYLRGNIIKYCSRFGKKENADIADEARKIQKYAEWLHEAANGEKVTL